MNLEGFSKVICKLIGRRTGRLGVGFARSEGSRAGSDYPNSRKLQGVGKDMVALGFFLGGEGSRKNANI